MRQSTEQELQIKGTEALKQRRGQELIMLEETKSENNVGADYKDG